MISVKQRIRRSPWVNKRIYNFLNRILRNNADLQTLNCGLIPKSGYQVDAATAPKLLTRLGLELYHLVGSQISNQLSKTILEIGCGRGGGTHYFLNQFKPDRLIGIDFSRESIRICRQRYKIPELRFVLANALQLPFEDDYFDAAISIELCHMVENKKRFFTEAKRVIKPGGHLTYLDFIYTNGESDHSIERVEEGISNSDLEIKKQEDLTDQVFEALKTAAPIREELINQKCPKPLQPFAHEFCMTTKSSAYTCFRDGRMRYLYYDLRTSV